MTPMNFVNPRGAARRLGIALSTTVALASTAFADQPPSQAVSAKPAAPASGAYLGAWVNPQGLAGDDGKAELQQLPQFDKYIGRELAIFHVYVQFQDPFPSTALTAIAQDGSIPLLDWDCWDVDQIVNGSQDAQITAYAQSLKSFGQPVFLRWFWEMNLNSPNRAACNAYGRGPVYVAAWQHIWTLITQAGATNVAFVWCPNAGGDSTPYYPGDAYVDWIAADNYDLAHQGAQAFQYSFNSFYNRWSGVKPLMVGETGATAVDQYQYIQSIGTVLPALYPNFKAFLYFDAPGTNGNWSLDGNGIAAMRALAAMPYFNP